MTEMIIVTYPLMKMKHVSKLMAAAYNFMKPTHV